MEMGEGARWTGGGGGAALSLMLKEHKNTDARRERARSAVKPY
jgi:hypothetical protein